MRKDRYLLFRSPQDATEFLDSLNSEYGQIWDLPNKHPFDDRTIVAWNDEHLAAHSHLLEGIGQLSPEEAKNAGWIFGRLRGPFAHARSKLEEAQLLQDALSPIAPLPNLAVYRSIYIAFLGATYAIKESVGKTCKRLSPEALSWFEEQWLSLQANPTVKGLYDLNNTNKHEPSALPLTVNSTEIGSTRIVGASRPGPTKVIMGGEGIFGLQHEGTSRGASSHLLATPKFVGKFHSKWGKGVSMDQPRPTQSMQFASMSCSSSMLGDYGAESPISLNRRADRDCGAFFY